jgi:hypothetical protein
LAVVEEAVVAVVVVGVVADLPSFLAREAAVPSCGAFADFDEGDDEDEEDEDEELRR